jgi:hypothetical protein
VKEQGDREVAQKSDRGRSRMREEVKRRMGR